MLSDLYLEFDSFEIQEKGFELVNPCKYSFKDLLKATGRSDDTTQLYAMTQDRRNIEVIVMCMEAGWYWHNVVSGKQIYTAFSPERVRISI